MFAGVKSDAHPPGCVNTVVRGGAAAAVKEDVAVAILLYRLLKLWEMFNGVEPCPPRAG